MTNALIIFDSTLLVLGNFYFVDTLDISRDKFQTCCTVFVISQLPGKEQLYNTHRLAQAIFENLCICSKISLDMGNSFFLLCGFFPNMENHLGIDTYTQECARYQCSI